MKRGIFTTLLTITSLLPLSALADNTNSTTITTQAKAILSAACTISAQSLSFSNLPLPLSAQSASSNMTVLCSLNAPYTIGLAYGGVYGQGTGSTVYTDIMYNANPTGQNGALYEVVNESTGAVYQYYSAKGTPGINLNTICNGLGGTVSGSNCTVGTAAYAYGKMIGVAKGDSVGYFIQVPNDPGKVWNAGNSSYSATGSGDIQTIPVTGTLVPAQSGSAYT